MTPSRSNPTPFDTLIINARVVDGTGAPWFWGEVGVAGGQIVAIGSRGSLSKRHSANNSAHTSANTTIDADGLVLAPGFIDIQSHSIAPLLRDGRAISKVAQGVTSEIMGEGWTPAPFGGLRAHPFPPSSRLGLSEAWIEAAHGWTRFGQWLEALAAAGSSVNVGSFLAGGSLREYACGLKMGAANDAELATQRQIMREAMEDGAFGVAYALIYPPDVYVPTSEIVAVCRVVAEFGGVYITHLRSESGRFLEALAEAIEIGTESGAAVEVYHLKASGAANWPKMAAAIERITAARAAGHDITADMYPYPASGTGLDSLLPDWVSEGGQFWQRLADPTTRAQILQEMEGGAGADMAGDMAAKAEQTMPVGFRQPALRPLAGKRLSEIAALRGQSASEAVIDLLMLEQQRIATIFFTMTEDNLRRQIVEPWVKISSDAGGLNPQWAEAGPVHPRAYGAFARPLRHFVRELGLVSLEQMVAKMTHQVALRLGLPDRGQIAIGKAADLVLFDPNTISDHATFDQPHQLATGVARVWVNGVLVWHNGAHTGATPGQVLRGPGWTGR
jgi:N-acyl-D-amino-acid deacylase